MPTVVTREYNPSTGALIGNISQLDFGRVPFGATSSIKVIDFAFSGLDVVSSIKIGVTSSGGLVVNSSAQGITSDGSSSNGKFGIEHSSSFTAKTSLSRHFSGLNSSSSAGDSNNVTISTRNATTSQFVYLDIENDTTLLGSGVYRIFIDFE